MMKLDPVIFLLKSDNRKTLRSAISMGSIIPNKCLSLIFSAASFGSSENRESSIGVFTIAGEMALTLIDLAANSRAIVFTAEFRAAFVAEYSSLPFSVFTALIDEIKIMLPPSLSKAFGEDTILVSSIPELTFIRKRLSNSFISNAFRGKAFCLPAQ